MSFDKLQGYKNEPLFDYIEFNDIVFDTLHMLLRITGKFLIYYEILFILLISVFSWFRYVCNRVV
jgi:hypothetical protein